MIKVTFKQPTRINTQDGVIVVMHIFCNRIKPGNLNATHEFYNDVLVLGRRETKTNFPEIEFQNPSCI